MIQFIGFIGSKVKLNIRIIPKGKKLVLIFLVCVEEVYLNLLCHFLTIINLILFFTIIIILMFILFFLKDICYIVLIDLAAGTKFVPSEYFILRRIFLWINSDQSIVIRRRNSLIIPVKEIVL